MPARLSPLALALGLVLIAGNPTRASAEAVLTLESTEWGIAGVCVERTFNPVRLEIRNDGDEAFDGTVVVRAVPAGRFATTQLTYETELFLAAGETRWVPLTVFATEGLDFRLETPTLDQPPLPLDPCTFNKPVVARLLPDDEPNRSPLPVVRLEGLPTKAVAMDALKALLIADTMLPQPSQQRALLTWIHRGGTLVIAEGTRGRPQLGGELASFNAPPGEYAVGRGLVWVTERPAEEITRDLVQDVIATRETGAPPPQPALTNPKSDQPQLGTVNVLRNPSEKYPFAFDADSSVISQLGYLVQPRSFALLFIPLAIAYGVLLYLLGRQASEERWHWPQHLGALLLLVVAASVLLVAASPVSTSASLQTGTVSLLVPTGQPADEKDARPDESKTNAANGATGEAIEPAPREQVFVRQWEVRQTGLALRTKRSPQAASQVMHIEGPAANVEIIEGPSQSIRLDEAPLTRTTGRTAGFVETAVPRVIVRASQASDGRLSEVSVSLHPSGRPLDLNKIPIAVLMTGARYVLLYPSDNTLQSNPRSSDQAEVIGLPLDRRTDFVWNMMPVSYDSGRRWRWAQPVSMSPLRAKDRKQQLLYDTLTLLPFADSRVSGAFTPREMTLPAGVAKLMLPVPLSDEFDLLGDGAGDRRYGLQIWVLKVPIEYREPALAPAD